MRFHGVLTSRWIATQGHVSRTGVNQLKTEHELFEEVQQPSLGCIRGMAERLCCTARLDFAEAPHVPLVRRQTLRATAVPNSSIGSGRVMLHLVVILKNIATCAKAGRPRTWNPVVASISTDRHAGCLELRLHLPPRVPCSQVHEGYHDIRSITFDFMSYYALCLRCITPRMCGDSNRDTRPQHRRTSHRTICCRIRGSCQGPSVPMPQCRGKRCRRCDLAEKCSAARQQQHPLLGPGCIWVHSCSSMPMPAVPRRPHCNPKGQ